jgi:hypothetical protein
LQLPDLWTLAFKVIRGEEMSLLPLKSLLDGTKVPGTTTSEMRNALGTLRDFLAAFLGEDSDSTAGLMTKIGSAPADSRYALATSIGSVQGASRKHIGSAPGGSSIVTYAIDELVTSDGAGNYQSTRAWAGTINMAALGVGGLDVGAVAANTWYYTYGITKPDGTKGLIASLSAISPSFANAAGFTKWARIGSLRTDSSKFPRGFDQDDRCFQYNTSQAVASGTVSAAVPLGSFIPPTYSKFLGYVYINPGSTGVTSISAYPSSTSGNVLVNMFFPAGMPATSSYFEAILPLYSIYINAAIGSGAVYLNCIGYEDNF